MPDTLNPASVRAACDAMRAAYLPDCILLRPDAMEAAIGAFLAAEAERGWGMRPRVATVAMLQDGHHAARRVVRGGVCGMTIEAQTRHEAARENAAWTAMWDAAAIGAKP